MDGASGYTEQSCLHNTENQTYTEKMDQQILSVKKKISPLRNYEKLRKLRIMKIEIKNIYQTLC